jgi:2-polyprenyl-6-methoxyphenol hydroxylase-like FAD-dependent oxidoreductase
VRNPILKQAVVVGAGMARVAAAKAMAPHFEKVTVFDRDSLPDAPAPPSGTPQSRLTHALLAGGHSRSIVCFPGSRPISWAPARSGYGFAAICGWSCPASDSFPQRDLGYDQFALSRPALERVCRYRLEQEPSIEIPRASPR